jgi:hypothetical protein
MNVPHKITKLTPEQAYIYGFLDAQMNNEELKDNIKRNENAMYISDSKSTAVYISDMPDKHLTNAYNKLIRLNKGNSQTARDLLNEIEFRELEEYINE